MKAILNNINPSNTFKILLVSIAILLYANTLKNGYNLDDNLVTQNHPLTSKGISAIAQIFTSPYYTNQADITFGYRPLVHVSFAIEHQFFGEKPAVSHFINILLYAICVLLLFNLFSKWDTNEYKLIPLIATLLFVTHPVHTEVVASIKNRDELLAFLFVLLAALSIQKFLTKGNLFKLFLAAIYFALAMLSKKSAYPMAILIPIAAVILNKPTVKQTLAITLALAIPAAVFASDFLLGRFLLLAIAPLIAISITQLALNKNLVYNKISTLFTAENTRIVIYFISSLFAILSILTNELLYVIPLLFVYAFAPKAEIRHYLIVAMFQMAIVSLFFNLNKLVTLAMVITIVELFYGYKQKDKQIVPIIIGVFTCLMFIYMKPDIMKIVLLLSVVLFGFLLSKKPIWAFIHAIFTLVVSGLFVSVSPYQLVLFAIALLHLINSNNQTIKWHKATIIGLAFIQTVYLLLLPTSPTQIRNIANNIITQNTEVKNPIVNNYNNQGGAFKEGRSLHYIENTLVAEHTPIQTIATGFTTLGEYLRLMVFPNNLTFYYGYAIITTTSLTQLPVWMSIILHLGLIFIAFLQLKKRPLISIGIGWYLLSIILFSNWVELVAGMVGERLSFSASAGFCLFVASVLIWIKPGFSFKKPKLIEIGLLVVVLLFGIQTMARNQDWKDPLTLMQNDIIAIEESAYAQHTLALNLMYYSTLPNTNPQKAAQMQADAINHLKKSITIYPLFFNSNFDLARIYVGQEDFVNAKPNLENALKIDSTNLFVLEELSKTCFELKLPLETEEYANKYIEKVPMNENVHEVLIYSMITNNYPQKAFTYAERALKYYPQNEVINQMYADAKKQLTATE